MAISILAYELDHAFRLAEAKLRSGGAEKVLERVHFGPLVPRMQQKPSHKIELAISSTSPTDVNELSDFRQKESSGEMHQKTVLDDHSPELAERIRETQFIARSYLGGLSFVVGMAGQDPDFVNTHLLARLSQDLLQSAVSISALAMEGLLNVAKRELRFLVEASVKIAAVQLGSYRTSVADKVQAFEKELRSPSIAIRKQIELRLLPEREHAAFGEEVGRLYGLTSTYVHLSPDQIKQSIAAAAAGVTAGKERPSDVDDLNRLAERVMAASLVFLFHSVPTWVAGDWLVEHDGSSIDWLFMKSRFIAAMDEQFDYKAERKERLAKIQAIRAAAVRF